MQLWDILHVRKCHTSSSHQGHLGPSLPLSLSLSLSLPLPPQAVKEEDLGEADLDEEVKKRAPKLYIPNWFSVEVKTGVGGGRGGKREEERVQSCCIMFII